MKFNIWLIALVAVSIQGCASSDTYEQTIRTHSQEVKRYQGFYNQYEVGATLMDTRVTSSILERMAEFKKWSPSKLQEEIDRAKGDSHSNTKLFLSLYTPERQHNDLDKSKSMWEIYMEVDGRRYEGRVKKKSDLNLFELKSLYPYHTRWSKGYEVVFGVPFSAIEGHPIKVVLASSLGASEFKF
ncbi:MAG: hypothetical protein H6626_09015 [Pseudobdellovibrionaceae bacterium]|nr:hypothetical protein [Bdellovibrionales bacterium]USN46356.1 MAG: hypothetical protein H6626_09015 [Pseudobdellovibrionaceae bacterium]